MNSWKILIDLPQGVLLFILGRPDDIQPERQIFLNRKKWEDAPFFRHITDPEAGNLVRRPTRNLPAFERDFT